MVATRERLLDAALRAFAANGVDGTAITELEERAGLAPGSGGFYRYFRTKDEALEAAVGREIERLSTARSTRPVPERRDDLRQALAAAIDDWLDTLSTLRRLIAILARERPRIPDLAREIATELVDGWVRNDEALIAAVATTTSDAATAPDTDAMGAVLVSALVGYHLATDYFGGPPVGVDRHRFVTAVVDLFLPVT